MRNIIIYKKLYKLLYNNCSDNSNDNNNNNDKCNFFVVKNLFLENGRNSAGKRSSWLACSCYQSCRSWLEWNCSNWKRKKEKRHFLLCSDRILLRIVKVKAICRVIRRGPCKDKFVNLQTEVSYGLLWEIFNGIRNLINAKYSKINTYAAFNKVQICSTKRMQLELL